MNEPALVSRRRIVVALDASAQSRTALEAAAKLAATLEADLSGVFVEDADLLRLAELPFAREVVPGLPARRVADAVAMERTLRRLAAQAQRELEELSLRYRVASSFTVVRGHVLQELLEAASGADIFALGVCSRLLEFQWRLGRTARGVLASASCSILMTRQGEVLGTPVVALHEDTPAAERVLRTAAELARLGDGRLIVIACGPTESHASLKARVQNLGAAGLSIEFHAGDGMQRRQLSELLAHLGCGVVVLSRDSPLLADEEGPFFVANLPCPALVIP